MQRFIGLLLIAIGVVGVIAQWLVGIHRYVDDASRDFLGQYASGSYGSPVGEAIVYLVFYFIAVSGLALMATLKSPS